MLRQQAALERLGDAVLALVHARVVDRERDAVGGEAQDAEVVRGEAARRRGGRDHHPADLALSEQRDADHRGDLLRPRVLHEQRLSGLRHAPAKASPVNGAPGLPSDGGPQDQPALLDEVDRRGVGLEHAAHAGHEVGQDVVERAVGERGVDQQLHAAHQLGHSLGLLPRGLLAHQRLALLLAAPAIRHVADEARHEDLALHLHLRHGRLRREAACRRDAEALRRRSRSRPGRCCRRVARRRASWRSRSSGGVTSARNGLPIASRGRPAEHPLRGDVPDADDPVTVQRDECVGRVVEHEPRARLALAQPAARSRRSRSAGRGAGRACAR